MLKTLTKVEKHGKQKKKQLKMSSSDLLLLNLKYKLYLQKPSSYNQKMC